MIAVTGLLLAATACSSQQTTGATAPSQTAPTRGDADAVVTVAVRSQPCARLVPRRGVGTRVSTELVLTAAHVVDGATRGVWVDDEPVEVLAIDPRLDLAILRSSGPRHLGPRFVADPTGSVALVTTQGSVATTVLRTVRLGVANHSDGTYHRRRSHVVDGAVGAGTSGAPLVDATGAVAGVALLSSRRSEITYVVAGDEVAAFVRAASRTRLAGDGGVPGSGCAD